METTDEYARFEPLSQQDIIDLLRTNEVGRVAWNRADGPVILPVAYAYADRAVAFSTAEDGLLAELASGGAVAFQIDEFDVGTGTGWSVLVRATAARITDPGEIAAWDRRLPTPWAPGPRHVMIRLDPVAVTGRIVVRG
jgi:nitroimidazol reductase NimA-like FMN-containing flavoprotein (pyridoxamine 5'-phosphate oxidase superfamily)